nr:hypothetical protein 1634Bnrm3_p155 [Cryptomonas sp.]
MVKFFHIYMKCLFLIRNINLRKIYLKTNFFNILIEFIFFVYKFTRKYNSHKLNSSTKFCKKNFDTVTVYFLPLIIYEIEKQKFFNKFQFIKKKIYLINYIFSKIFFKIILYTKKNHVKVFLLLLGKKIVRILKFFFQIFFSNFKFFLCKIKILMLNGNNFILNYFFFYHRVMNLPKIIKICSGNSLILENIYLKNFSITSNYLYFYCEILLSGNSNLQTKNTGKRHNSNCENIFTKHTKSININIQAFRLLFMTKIFNIKKIDIQYFITIFIHLSNRNKIGKNGVPFPIVLNIFFNIFYHYTNLKLRYCPTYIRCLGKKHKEPVYIDILKKKIFNIAKLYIVDKITKNDVLLSVMIYFVYFLKIVLPGKKFFTFISRILAFEFTFLYISYFNKILI